MILLNEGFHSLLLNVGMILWNRSDSTNPWLVWHHGSEEMREAGGLSSNSARKLLRTEGEKQRPRHLSVNLEKSGLGFKVVARSILNDKFINLQLLFAFVASIG